MTVDNTWTTPSRHLDLDPCDPRSPHLASTTPLRIGGVSDRTTIRCGPSTQMESLGAINSQIRSNSSRLE